MSLHKLPPRSNQHKLLLFLSDWKWREVVVQEIKNKKNLDTEYCIFSVKKLKGMLCNRDLLVTGIEQQIIKRLSEEDWNNNTIVNKIGPSKGN